MAPKRNNVIPNGHFHKDWQSRVKTWFDQPARKLRRRQTRAKKAKEIAPRPIKGLLRPVVRCPTQRYNIRARLGRGFTMTELKAAGLNKKMARTIGIAVDHRRTNKSKESLQVNAQRLKEYRSKLILFPKKINKPKKGDSTAEECRVAEQLAGIVLPIDRASRKPKAAKITQEMKDFKVYEYLRKQRSDTRLAGPRQKRRQDAIDAAK